MTMTDQEKLPGEGDRRTRTEERARRPCDCGEVAHYCFTYLLPNARTNRASRGYGRDDLTWCADARRFARKHCPRPTVDGMEHCGRASADSPLAHLFLVWRTVEEGPGKEGSEAAA